MNNKNLLPFWLVVLASAILYFAYLGSYPLTDRDEGLYGTAVMNMEKSGDYVIPTLNGKPFLVKPIFIYWLALASRAVWGQNEFALRFTSAFSALILMVLVGLSTKKLMNSSKMATLTAVSMAFVPLIAVTAHAFLLDIPLAIAIFTCLFAFFMGTETKNGLKDQLWYALAWIALGVGFLIKGPVAPAVAFPTAALYAFLQKDFKRIVVRCNLPMGLIICAGINVWYIVAHFRIGPEFFNGFFGSEVIKRGAKSLVGHQGGPFYYVFVLLIGMFPFSASAACGLWQAIRIKFSERVENQASRYLFFCSIASLVTIVAFSAAATKLPHYVLPAVPFLAILSAYFLENLSVPKRVGEWVLRVYSSLLIVQFSILLLMAVAIQVVLNMFWSKIVLLIKPDSSEYALPMETPDYLVFSIFITIFVLIMGGFSLYFLKKRKIANLVVSLGAGSLLFCFCGIGCAIKTLEIIHSPAKVMCGELVQKAGDDATFASYGLWKPSLFYYLDGRHVRRFRYSYADHFADIRDEFASPKPFFVISRTMFKDKLSKIKDFHVVGEFGSYLLAGNQAALDRWKK